MDEDIRRIQMLIGVLMEAKWRRFNESNDPLAAVGSEENYLPVSTEEKTIWDALTGPENYEALCLYVAEVERDPINEYAAALHLSLLDDASHRHSAPNVATLHIRCTAGKDSEIVQLVNYLVSYEIMKLPGAVALAQRFLRGEHVEVKVSETIMEGLKSELDRLGFESL